MPSQTCEGCRAASGNIVVCKSGMINLPSVFRMLACMYGTSMACKASGEMHPPFNAGAFGSLEKAVSTVNLALAGERRSRSRP